MEEQILLNEEIEELEEPLDKEASIKSAGQDKKEGSKRVAYIMGIVGVLFAIIISGSIYLAFQSTETIGAVRDVFVILMALTLVVIGVAMVILILQLSNLLNILKNDIKPILESGTDTVNDLRGTVRFMSDNLVEPVIKLNESLATFKKIGQLFKIIRD